MRVSLLSLATFGPDNNRDHAAMAVSFAMFQPICYCIAVSFKYRMFVLSALLFYLLCFNWFTSQVELKR